MTSHFLPNAINPMDYDPTQSVGQFPVGKHPVVITAAEVKAAKDEQSGLVEFTLAITDGPAKGTTGAYRLNLFNKSAKAAEIAHKQLSALCHVTQRFQLGQGGNDLSVLFGVPFVIEVTVQKENPEYTQVNKVFDMQGNEPGKAPAPQQGQNSGFGGQPPQQQPQGFQQPQQTQQPVQQGWGAPQGQQQPQGGQQGGYPIQQANPPADQGAPAGGQGWGQQQTQQPQQQQPPAQQGWQQQNPQGGQQQPAAWGPQG